LGLVLGLLLFLCFGFGFGFVLVLGFWRIHVDVIQTNVTYMYNDVIIIYLAMDKQHSDGLRTF